LKSQQNKKQHLHYSGKTGIAVTKGFQKKLLADYAVNIGNVCEFGCTFCYVPAVTTKQKTVQDVLAKGYQFEEFSLYRDRLNVLDYVSKDLQKISPEDTSTVFFCTTCDPCSTEKHANTSTEAIRLIVERSNLQVRVLSKSLLIKVIAQHLSAHKKRVIYSLSTGTSIPEISAAIEENASPIAERVEALHWLQDSGYRTYGMICPVLPSEVSRVDELLKQVRPDRCEHVWAEAMNVRGKSLVKTKEALAAANLEDHALELQRILGTGNRKNWIEYSKKLFLAFQSQMAAIGQLDKLRYLQYVTAHDRDFFQGQTGAICL